MELRLFLFISPKLLEVASQVLAVTRGLLEENSQAFSKAGLTPNLCSISY